MLILAAADLHGKAHKLAYLDEAAARLRPDVVVLAGDLTGYVRSGHTVAALGRLSAPVLAVRGNSDFKRVDRLLARAPSAGPLHLRSVTLDGVVFVGVGGTIPLPFHSKLGWWESGVVKRLNSLVGPGQVLVAHPPPYGILDEVGGRFHAGSRSLRRLVLERKPGLMICGHIHESPGTKWLKNTLVVNCSLSRRCGGALIEFRPGSAPRADLLPGPGW